MKTLLLYLFLLTNLPLLGQGIDMSNLCTQLDDLVNEKLPESFEGVTYEESTIDEISGTKPYKKMQYQFMGNEFLYFTEAGETNKRVLLYPFATGNKEEAIQAFVGLKEGFEKCELVYTTVRQNPNPNIGLIAYFTVGLDRRFYNSNLRLYQYESDSVSRYWIEYELIAPKQD